MKRLWIQSGYTKYKHRQEPSERDSDHLVNGAKWDSTMLNNSCALKKTTKQRSHLQNGQKESLLTEIMAEDWYMVYIKN